MVKFHKHLMCKQCKENYFEECESCHNSVDKDELETLWKGEEYHKICMACLKKDYFKCDNCNDWFPKNECRSNQGKSLCKSCFKFAAAAIVNETDDEEALISAMLAQTLIHKKLINRKAAASRNYANEQTFTEINPSYCEECVETCYENDHLDDGLCP